MQNFTSIFNIILNDVAEPWQLGFQDSAAPGLTGLVTLHNTIGFYLIVISFSVFWVLFSLIYYYSFNKNPIAHKYLTHGTVLELVWTITPALILIFIAFPSFRLLYLMDEVISPTLTIKIVGFFTVHVLSFFIIKERLGRAGGLKLYILNKMKDTNLNGKKNNMYYQTILNKNTLPLKFLSKVRLSYSKQLYKKDYLLFPYKLGLFQFLPKDLWKQDGRKYYHVSNIRAVNRIGPHNEDVLSVIIGSLLGDGYANKRSGEGVRICYRQSKIHSLASEREYFSSSLQGKLLMDPNYITGFSDGETCFRISIYRRKDCKTGWWVIPTFTIELHKKDASILSQLKSFFGVGSLNIRKSNGQIIYTVGSVKDLMEVIIPHFSKYPLMTKK